MTEQFHVVRTGTLPTYNGGDEVFFPFHILPQSRDTPDVWGNVTAMVHIHAGPLLEQAQWERKITPAEQAWIDEHVTKPAAEVLSDQKVADNAKAPTEQWSVVTSGWVEQKGRRFEVGDVIPPEFNGEPDGCSLEFAGIYLYRQFLPVGLDPERMQIQEIINLVHPLFVESRGKVAESPRVLATALRALLIAATATPDA